MDSFGSEEAPVNILIAYVDGNFVMRRDTISFSRTTQFVPRMMPQSLLKGNCFRIFKLRCVNHRAWTVAG
jgi:hypothetical protein